MILPVHLLTIKATSIFLFLFASLPPPSIATLPINYPHWSTNVAGPKHCPNYFCQSTFVSNCCKYRSIANWFYPICSQKTSLSWNL